MFSQRTKKRVNVFVPVTPPVLLRDFAIEQASRPWFRFQRESFNDGKRIAVLVWDLQ